MERMGVSSYSSLNEGFKFFEKHGELKRIQTPTRRFLIRPEKIIEIEPENPRAKKNKGIGVPIGGYRSTDSAGIGVPIHNINNTNTKKLRERAHTQSKSVRLPSDFVINAENQKLCLDNDVDPQFVLDKFIYHVKSKDWRRADWNAALSKWTIDEIEFIKKNSKTTYKQLVSSNQAPKLTEEQKKKREEDYERKLELSRIEGEKRLSEWSKNGQKPDKSKETHAFNR